jgi:flagellum-specific ATP synthase
MISIGAYQKGSSPEIDEAVRLMPRINAFLRQGIPEKVSAEKALDELKAVLQ